MGAIEPTPSDDGAVIVERLSYTRTPAATCRTLEESHADLPRQVLPWPAEPVRESRPC